MYLIDYHTHSKHSIDGKETVDCLCHAAFEAGLAELAVTDHYDPYQKDVFCEKTYHAREIRNEILEAKSKWRGKLKVCYGIESGQLHYYPQAAEKVMENGFDYVIGSLHNLPGDLDIGLVEYTKENHRKIFLTYFEELTRMAQSEHYDCLGHLDFPKRYAARAGFFLRAADYMEQMEPILKDVIGRGKGIEVNTSGLRQQLGETMPSAEVVCRYRELGGEIITVGSDAHTARDVGAGIPEAYELIRQAGFRYITAYESRKPNFIKL